MKVNLFRKLDGTYADAFREIALHHNVRISKLFAATIGLLGLILCIIDWSTKTNRVFKYPGEYSAAILFIFIASCVCYFAFLFCNKLNAEVRIKAYKLLARIYPLIVVFSSLWITFVMQHNPSNTMSIFVLGLLMVSSLWIFEKQQAIIIALLILILFDGGLHYFQTDPCKLFANYITGTCVSIFFVCISRVSFSVNYNHFIQLKKIEETNQDITRINEMQTEILSVVAHDLLAPVHSVMSLTDLLKNSETTAEERKEYYDLILATCSRSNRIVDDLLTAARNEESGIMVAYTCVNDLCEQIIHHFIKTKANTRQIIYELPDEKIYAFIDHLKMTRVFENLLGNAVKFTRADGIISVKVDHDTEKIYFIVTDNGIGIPTDRIPFLFNRFSKAGRSGLNGERSYGLGLSICKLIIKQHQGDITISSEEGKWTKVKITIPIAGDQA